MFLFFKPGQQHSKVTLQHLAVCEREFGESVRWTAVVSDRFSKAESEAAVKEAQIAMPVVIDVGDALYGSLGVVLTPAIGIANSNHVLAAYLPFAQVNYDQALKLDSSNSAALEGKKECEQKIRRKYQFP